MELACYYNGEHNIYFGKLNHTDSSGKMLADFDMYKDFGLLPVKTEIVSPDVNSKSIDIPGGYGNVNLTDFLTGYPLYKTRKDRLEFRLIDEKTKDDVIRKLMLNIHGHTLNIFESKADGDNYVIDDYYFTGYFEVKHTTDDHYTKIEISYDIQPLKYFREPIVKTITGTDSAEIVEMPEGMYPQVISFNYKTDHPEIGVAKFQFINRELNINSNFNIMPGENYYGSLARVSNLSGNNAVAMLGDIPDGVVTIKFYPGIV